MPLLLRSRLVRRSRLREWWAIAPARCADSPSSSARVLDNLLLPAVLPALPAPLARVRRCVLANAVRCTPPALLLPRAGVRRWVLDVLAWERVQVVCLARLPARRHQAPLLVPALASARPHAVPASVTPARAASRKGQ